MGNSGGSKLPNLLSNYATFSVLGGLPTEAALKQRRLVEPDGIEPTTFCLQSRRSPN